MMDRTDGLLFGGVALLSGAFQRLEENAVDMTRRDIDLSVRRHIGHSRRRVRDTVAFLELVIAVAMLVRGLRTALREWSAVDDVDAATLGNDSEAIV